MPHRRKSEEYRQTEKLIGPRAARENYRSATCLMAGGAGCAISVVLMLGAVLWHGWWWTAAAISLSAAVLFFAAAAVMSFLSGRHATEHLQNKGVPARFRFAQGGAESWAAAIARQRRDDTG